MFFVFGGEWGFDDFVVFMEVIKKIREFLWFFGQFEAVFFDPQGLFGLIVPTMQRWVTFHDVNNLNKNKTNEKTILS